jgi:hypothetical protein
VIKKQQLFESQTVPVYHETAAVEFPIIPVYPGTTLIRTAQSVRLYAHNV